MRHQSPSPKKGYRARPQQVRRRQSTPNIQVNSDEKVRKRGNVYYIFRKERRGVSWRMVFMLLIVFFGAVGSAFSYAQIHSLNQEIRSNRRAIDNQLIINHDLESQLSVAERYTREEIERLAYERLGMSEPDASQIFYFDVPSQSFVSMSINAQSHEPSENYFWQGIRAFFSDIRDRFSD